MLAPSLLSGMKQRYEFSADGIEPVGFVIFVTIAALACQSQVFQVGLSFGALGKYMVS
jgi:hypothetical protein